MRRRAVLLAGLGGAGLGCAGLAATGALVQADVLPGRVRMWQAIGVALPDGVPAVKPGVLRGDSFRSAARRGVITHWVVAYPPGVDSEAPSMDGGARLPVCIVLHGRGGDASSMIDLGLDRFLADATAHGSAPFALAAVDGGDTYWHARRDGTDPGAMVIDELLPLLARAGLGTRTGDRVAFLGWSMGGYGALLLGSRLGASRVAAVAAESPALWLRPGDSAPGAFDDAQDFRRGDVFAARAALRGIDVRIDCGLGDPFLHATREFVAGLNPRPAGGFEAGGHDDAYWRRMAPAQLRFIGAALAP